ncbi:hypothetical protein FNV43_RR16633 [Rhamnella rubrinervis]|uniref:Uncharacterized protein n=1 Tax=Rhamnella rubrinervis TaxID=2594499 RepID=A0A8K0MDJ2_9ROSA|nr:hypothetical protein FNV43_RR16633 [Rhamnella rubrinervis]
MAERSPKRLRTGADIASSLGDMWLDIGLAAQGLVATMSPEEDENTMEDPEEDKDPEEFEDFVVSEDSLEQVDPWDYPDSD